MVNHQSLDQITQCNDKILRSADPDNGMDNFVVVAFLVRNICFFGNQLFDNISEILRECLPYLRTGILRCHLLCNLYQTVQRDLIPVLKVILFTDYNIQLFYRIINQRCQ